MDESKKEVRLQAFKEIATFIGIGAAVCVVYHVLNVNNLLPDQASKQEVPGIIGMALVILTTQWGNFRKFFTGRLKRKSVLK